MGTQIAINKSLIKYLELSSYRPNLIIDKLIKETLSLGGVAQMQISPEQGQFLEIIVMILQAKNCLEIGRFTGLSSLCIAKGLSQNAKLIAIDKSDEFLPIAEKYWKMAKVDSKIESVIGEGVEVMQSMIDRQHSFDFIFVDADKKNYLNYYELSLKLLKSNGIIIIDNMLWHGDVADENKNDQQTNTIRNLNKKNPRR